MSKIQYWLCNSCNVVYKTTNASGFSYEIEDIEVECPCCHGYMDIYEIDKEYYDKMQEMDKKINDLKKRDKRHQREKLREPQNKQSKEFKLFDKESKEYSYSLIFTNDLKEIFDAKNDCKALFEKDQDNDYFYCFDKTGNYIKCISQDNGFNGTWNEFKNYSMIQWNNSECVVIYIKDYSESIIEPVLEDYLNEFQDVCLESEIMEDNLMEHNMENQQQTVTIEVKTYTESRQFEIISKERLLKIIDDLNASEVYRELCKMHESDRIQNHYACINLENGQIEYSSIMNNSSLHPFDDVSIEIMSIGNTSETVYDKMDWIEWYDYTDVIDILKKYIKIDSDLENDIIEYGVYEMKSEIQDLEGFSDFLDFYESDFFDCLENFESDFNMNNIQDQIEYFYNNDNDDDDNN